MLFAPASSQSFCTTGRQSKFLEVGANVGSAEPIADISQLPVWPGLALETMLRHPGDLLTTSSGISSVHTETCSRRRRQRRSNMQSGEIESLLGP